MSKKSHAASKAKTKEATKREWLTDFVAPSMSAVANSSKEIRLVSEKQNTVSVEKGVTASSDSGKVFVNYDSRRDKSVECITIYSYKQEP